MLYCRTIQFAATAIALASACANPASAQPSWEAEREYEEQHKSPWRALGYEALVPGWGFFYAGEKEEAALEWSGLALGAFFVIDGGGYACRWFGGSSCATHSTTVAVGWVFLVGSRLFGLTNAPLAAARFNRALRARLGLDEDPRYSLFAAPARGGGVVGVGGRF
jgi:hypothetical protein